MNRLLATYSTYCWRIIWSLTVTAKDFGCDKKKIKIQVWLLGNNGIEGGDLAPYSKLWGQQCAFELIFFWEENPLFVLLIKYIKLFKKYIKVRFSKFSLNRTHQVTSYSIEGSINQQFPKGEGSFSGGLPHKRLSPSQEQISTVTPMIINASY